MNMNTTLSGEFNLVLTKPDGTVRETGWFDNLILNTGLDNIAASTGSGFLYYCQIGTGTSAPAVTQVQLDARVAGVAYSGSPTVVNSGSPNYSSLHTVAYPFPQGAVVGNMSEVGVGWASTGSLFSRTLITDGSGNPVTLTVTSIDQLTVYYRLNINPQITDATGSVTLAGTAYPFTGRPTNIGSFAINSSLGTSTTNPGPPGLFYTGLSATAYSPSMTLGPVTGSPSTSGGTSISIGLYGSNYTADIRNIAQATYAPGSYYQDSTLTIKVDQANLAGGIGGFSIPFYYSSFQYKFTNPIPKDNTKVLVLTFRTSWARA